jgi:hypothetical protein
MMLLATSKAPRAFSARVDEAPLYPAVNIGAVDRLLKTCGWMNRAVAELVDLPRVFADCLCIGGLNVPPPPQGLRHLLVPGQAIDLPLLMLRGGVSSAR